MEKIVLYLILGTALFLSNNAFAISISAQGQECSNQIDLSDTSSNNIIVESKFTVIEELGGNVYKLQLTGGYPRISSSNSLVCFDTTLGHAGDFPPADTPRDTVLPEKTFSIDAIGYFNGTELTITVNSFISTLTGNMTSTSPPTFSSSVIGSRSNIYVFDFDGTNFALKKWIYISGIVNAFGFVDPPGFYAEILQPNREISAIAISPGAHIEFRIEQ